MAKAQYLQERVQQMTEEVRQQHEAQLEQERRSAIERDAALAHLSAERRAYADLPKGLCPNCNSVIPLTALVCTRCQSMFGTDSAWTVRPIDEMGQFDILRKMYLAGKKLTADEVIFLAQASSADKLVAKLVSPVNEETLLHWAARLSLHREIALLLDNGADAEQLNNKGQKPIDLAEHYKSRELLSPQAEGQSKEDIV